MTAALTYLNLESKRGLSRIFMNGFYIIMNGIGIGMEYNEIEPL